MRTLTAVCLLAASAVVNAQPAAADDKETAHAEAQKQKEAARLEADEAKTRKQLEAARERLEKAAREVAELSGKLGAHARH